MAVILQPIPATDRRTVTDPVLFDELSRIVTELNIRLKAIGDALNATADDADNTTDANADNKMSKVDISEPTDTSSLANYADDVLNSLVSSTQKTLQELADKHNAVVDLLAANGIA